MRSLVRAVKKHNDAAQESMMTAEQAAVWAAEKFQKTGRWPVRRFRVEGATGGSSRLLSRSRAEATRVTYGGRVVEVVPTKDEALSALLRLYTERKVDP